MNSNWIAYFALSNARQPYGLFGIKGTDRLHHIYVIGKTGVGKTTLLETLIRADIFHGAGCALIDPHGDFAERLGRWMPEIRRADLVLPQPR